MYAGRVGWESIYIYICGKCKHNTVHDIWTKIYADNLTTEKWEHFSHST